MDSEDVLEKETMNSITCFFVYIDVNNQISHVSTETCSLEIDYADSSAKVTKNQLLGLIHRHKTWNNSKYSLMDILQYNVPYDFTTLMETSYSNIIKTVTTADEIVFEPSLCIFHNINSIYFLYQEIPKYWDDYQTSPLKPVLKITDGTVGVNVRKKTKRVSFKDLDMRHTKKARVRFS